MHPVITSTTNPLNQHLHPSNLHPSNHPSTHPTIPPRPTLSPPSQSNPSPKDQKHRRQTQAPTQTQYSHRVIITRYDRYVMHCDRYVMEWNMNCIVLEYLYCASQQPWAHREAFGSMSSKKRDQF